MSRKTVRRVLFFSGALMLSCSLSACRSLPEDASQTSLLPHLTLNGVGQVWNPASQSQVPVPQPERIYWGPDTATNDPTTAWFQEPTTPQVFRLSLTELLATKAAALAGDAQAAFRLANHYGLGLADWCLYLRWCAVTAELGGPREAAASIDALKLAGTHRLDVSRAFHLDKAGILDLEERVTLRHEGKAAFRLALFYGYSMNDVQKRDTWLRSAAQMGSVGAKVCADAWGLRAATKPSN